MSLPPALSATGRQRRLRLLPCLLMERGLSIAAVLGVLAYRFNQPRRYFAQATMQIARLPSNYQYYPAMMGDPTAHAQNLRRTDILYPVIDMLGLTQGYVKEGATATKQDTFKKLVESLEIQVDLGDTQVVRIGVYDRNPQQAATIAILMALAYRDMRMADLESANERAQSQYAEEVERGYAEVPKLAEEMKQLGARDQVLDPNPERASVVVTGQTTREYLSAKSVYLQAKLALRHAEVALGEARRAAAYDEPPVRILEEAVPPARTVPWWRGDPRTWTGF